MKSFIIDSVFFISKDNLIDLTILLDEYPEVFEKLGIPDCPDDIKGLFKSAGINLIFDDKGNVLGILAKGGVDIEKADIFLPLISTVIDNKSFIQLMNQDLSFFYWEFKDGKYLEKEGKSPFYIENTKDYSEE